jgi:hypothetical protein
MSRKHFLGTILFLLTAWIVQAQETERQYLSGTGLGNTVTVSCIRRKQQRALE